MISFLIGQPVVEKEFVTVLVGNATTGGVGYSVRVTDKLRQKISAENATEVRLHIYTHVTETALELYGFDDRAERELFLLLLDVSGIGPKTALALLNTGASEIIQAVQEANVAFFAAVPRVGKKLAQKIIIDLRTKLGALKELDLGPLSPKRQEVLLALQSLGFSETAVEQALQQLDVETLDLSDAVKAGIKLLGRK